MAKLSYQFKAIKISKDREGQTLIAQKVLRAEILNFLHTRISQEWAKFLKVQPLMGPIYMSIILL